MTYSRLDDSPISLHHVRHPSPPSMGPFRAFGHDSFNHAGRGRTTSRARRLKLLASYAPDWIITIALAAAFFALDKVDGYKRVFSLDDTSLRHSYAVHERVPNVALYCIAVLAPFVIQILINLLTVRSWWDFHNGTLGLVLGLSLTGAITQFTKLTVGRPRPDVIDRCQPLAGSVDPHWGLSNYTICTQMDKHLLNDGFRSFPSGHSSLSFAGLGFLSFYLAGKLHLFDERGHAGKAWISLAPLSGAALVAISRSMDYRHHWHDILVGSILGIVMAYFAYRQYFPPLTSPLSHRPYSPRVRREELERMGVAPGDAGDGAGARDGDAVERGKYARTHHRGASSLDTAHLRGASPGPLSPPSPTMPGRAARAGRDASRERASTDTADDAVAGTVPRTGPQSMRDVYA